VALHGPRIDATARFPSLVKKQAVGLPSADTTSLWEEKLNVPLGSCVFPTYTVTWDMLVLQQSERVNIDMALMTPIPSRSTCIQGKLSLLERQMLG